MNLKYKVFKTKNNMKGKWESIQLWILYNIISPDMIHEYCEDTELMVDYYNEEPDYEDYRHDYD